MGEKGDTLSNQSNQQAELLIAALGEIDNIKSKKMFGGNGIFYNDRMFAMVDSKGQCFFKVDNELAQQFSKKGSIKHSKMPYSSVPKNILNSRDELVLWAWKSIGLLS